MKINLNILSTASEIEQLVHHLRSVKENSPHHRLVISFDTEFIRESTYFPLVELIQIASDQESWIVDAQAFKKGHLHNDRKSYDPGLQPLLDLLQDASVLKVVHAAQGDQECLYTSFGVLASPILDTAVAASLCGLGEAIGLGKLIKAVLKVNLSKGHARTNWSVRPLPEHLLEYAHADVIHLVALSEALLERLEENGRKPWAMELSAQFADPSLYEVNPEELAHKLSRNSKLDRKSDVALLELVKWRENRVRKLNLPRRWVADDQVLIDLAQVRPKNFDHLSSFRGLNRGELKNQAETLLGIIRSAELKAAKVSEMLPVPMGRALIATPSELQVLELLKCFVGLLAEHYQISRKHLIHASQFLPLIRAKFQTVETLQHSGMLNTEAARLMGQSLVDFLNGRKTLGIQDNQVSILEPHQGQAGTPLVAGGLPQSDPDASPASEQCHDKAQQQQQGRASPPSDFSSSPSSSNATAIPSSAGHHVTDP